MIYRFISGIFIISLISKFLGFIRDVLITSNYGLNSQTDSYFVAVLICTIFFNLINSGLVSSLMIVSGVLKNKREKDKYYSSILSISLFFSILIFFGIYFYAPNLVSVFAYGFSESKSAITNNLVKIGSVIVIFNFITVIFKAYHQHSKKFNIPAAEGIILNIPLIIYLSFFNKNYGIEGLMIATITGYLLQSVVNVLSARTFGFKFLFNKNIFDENSKITFKMLLPIFFGSIASFINTLIDKTMASELSDGVISAYSLALKFRQLFIGLFILSIITPFFSLLSRNIDKETLVTLSIRGTRLILFSVVPITFFLIYFGNDLISIVFERNNFNKSDTLIVSNSLVYYSIGIIGVAFTGFFSKILFSLKKPVVPMVVNICSVLLNIILNFVLINRLGYVGLPLATSLSSVFSGCLLLNILHEYDILNFSDLKSGFFKNIFSAFFSILLLFLVKDIFLNFVEINLLIKVVILMPLFLISYVIISYLLREEASMELVTYIKYRISFFKDA